MQPLVTVVIPAYNAERWVGAAIQSVLEQTYKPVEIIVVDDGSTDGTERVVRSYGTQVRYLRQDNSGVSRARNFGAAERAGELIAFLDADDQWLPRKLEIQVQGLESRPESVASFTNSIDVDERTGTERRGTLRRGPRLVENLLLYSCCIGHVSSALIKGAAFQKVGGFDPKFSQCADWDMWLRVTEAGPVDVIDEPLVRYRIHQNNMSRNVALLESDTLAVLAKFYAQLEHAASFGPQRSRVYSNHYLILSGSYLHAGDVFASLRCLLLAVSFKPAALLRALGMPARFVIRTARSMGA